MFFAPSSEKIGSIKPWPGAAVPAGWLDCNGAAVSRSTYAALFTEIGTAYGVGDGATTFNLPDFRGRSIIGAGTGSGLTARARGASGGAESHPLTSGENGAHTHGTYCSSNTAAGGTINGSGNGSFTVVAGRSGSGTAHNNMQPWGCAFIIIKAAG